MTATAAAEVHSPAADARTLQRVVFGALGAQVALLTVTGVALFFWYQPGSGSGLVTLMRGVHRWAAVLMVPSSFVGAVLLGLRGRGRLVLRLPTAVALVAATLAAAFTGLLLPWDQLGLWSVEVGSNYRGYRWLGDDRVRFVLSGGTELGPDTVLRWLAVHAALGLALAGLLGFWARSWRDTATNAPKSKRGSQPM